MKRTLTFHDRVSGEALVSFTFDEIEALERQAFVGETGRNMAFSFSPDGEAWSLQNLSSEIGEDAGIFAMVVTDDRVIALIARWPEEIERFPTAGFEIWHAEIPEGAALATGTSR